MYRTMVAQREGLARSVETEINVRIKKNTSKSFMV